MTRFPRRILVAVDFEDVSDGALDTAIQLARTTQAHLCVMTALQDGEPERTASQHLERVIERAAAPDVEMQTHVERGAAHDAIVSASQHVHADLIVMGTHARSRMSTAESVATAVTRCAAVPVMVVRGALPRS
jgi:nucleotide-binding universal stress UspA family protein